MTNVAYYLPNIPDNASMARYNHALGISKQAKRAALITYPEEPPKAVAKHYDRVHILDPGGVRDRAAEARRVGEEFLDAKRCGDAIFLTTFHYAPALAGWRTEYDWILDVYDDPHQLRYHNGLSVHQLSVRGLTRLLHRADRAIHTVNPSTPHTFGRHQFFAVNGANVSMIEPYISPESSDPLQAVCAGVKGGCELLLRGIAHSDADVRLDVFGTATESEHALSTELDLDNKVAFHGVHNHSTVIEKIQAADVGFCLFPDKTDWYYAHPIKIGEYLAGGTIPIASAYPGIRQLTRDSGMLVEYDSDAVSEALTELYERPELRDRLKTRCRQRAEAIDWHDEREWFAKQALYGNKAGKH